MKELKQRFSIWFNRTHENHGTLWSERFKSLLVENNPEALKVVAAYIDLNPVRAGLCGDPKSYRWSGYAEALSGEEQAQRGPGVDHGSGEIGRRRCAGIGQSSLGPVTTARTERERGLIHRKSKKYCKAEAK